MQTYKEADVEALRSRSDHRKFMTLINDTDPVLRDLSRQCKVLEEKNSSINEALKQVQEDQYELDLKIAALHVQRTCERCGITKIQAFGSHEIVQSYSDLPVMCAVCYDYFHCSGRLPPRVEKKQS